MFNPFTEVAGGDPTDAALVEKANSGDRAALEGLVLRHQAWIYNIAVRMVFQPHDAEEVTQEVLVKVITRLGTFKGQSSFRTWLYRPAERAPAAAAAGRGGQERLHDGHAALPRSQAAADLHPRRGPRRQRHGRR